ncbi:MAG: hypothetical protein ABIJ34_04085 [archaeon]
MNYTDILVFTQLIIGLLSFVIFILLVTKFIGDNKKDYTIHRLTKTLAFLAFFMFLDNIFYCVSYFTGLGLSDKISDLFSSTGFQFFSTLGIFISLVLLTYFIFDKRIEHLKRSEDDLTLMQELNMHLEKKAKELESAHEQQHNKIVELEKFNEIAKEREAKMRELTKKIESLKGKMGTK